MTRTRARYDDPDVQEPDPTWDRDYNNFPLVDSEIMSLPTSGNYKRRHFRLKRSDTTQQFMIDDTTWGHRGRAHATGYIMGLVEAVSKLG